MRSIPIKNNIAPTDSEVCREFYSAISGTNMMTPDIVALRYNSAWILEISQGKFLGEKLVGLTAFNRKTGKADYDRSKSVQGDSMETIGEICEYEDEMDAEARIC